MPSPFPGMDPYLEGWIWADCHNTMIAAMRAQLNAKLPRRYVANTELYIWRENPLELERLILGGPDVYAAEHRPAPRKGLPTATVAAPITTVLPGGVECKQRYLRIVDSTQRRIVTVLEMLSPSNKTIRDNGGAYRTKREEYIGSGVNLVEIDFLRSGTRPPLGDPPPPESDYYVMVSRTWEYPRLGIWPISIREPLPPIPVPLDPGEPEVPLDLRAALDRAYEEGRYGEQLDYTQPPRPPLREPDATWAHELLKQRSGSTD